MKILWETCEYKTITIKAEIYEIEEHNAILHSLYGPK